MSPDPGAVNDWLSPDVGWLSIGLCCALFIGWFIAQWIRKGQEFDRLFLTDARRVCLDKGHRPTCGTCERCGDTNTHIWLYYGTYRFCGVCARRQVNVTRSRREHR